MFTLNHFIWLGLCALAIILGLAAIAIYINGAFYAYSTNFFFVTRPPLEGLPYLNLNRGWYVYLLRLAALAVVLMTAVHLPFIIAERRRGKGKQRVSVTI